MVRHVGAWNDARRVTPLALVLLLVAQDPVDPLVVEAPETAPAAPPAADPADDRPQPDVADVPSDTLPDALPPLDDGLVDPAGGALPAVFFAQARIRGELDESRDLSRAADTAAGAALTGRIGVDADLDVGRLVVVVGDGGRLGLPATAPALVPRPVLALLLEVALILDTQVAGMPALFSIGRAPVTLADGRLVGVEPYDARGRTLDGASLHGGSETLRVGGGVYWLGPLVADEGAPLSPDDEGALSGLAVVDAQWRDRDDAWRADLYALLHRDAVDSVTVPTLGARVDGSIASFLRARAGGDVQSFSVDGDDPFDPAGNAFHLEAGARATAPLSSLVSSRVPDVFVDITAEITAGDVVAGRSFRTPAPTQHGALGFLDMVAMDNTWSGGVSVGALDENGLFLDVGARLVGTVDDGAPLVDTAGVPLPMRIGGGLALVELDARFEVPLGKGLFLDVGYGVALPGAALVGDQPAQRLAVSLIATTDVGEDAPVPPLRAARR